MNLCRIPHATFTGGVFFCAAEVVAGIDQRICKEIAQLLRCIHHLAYDSAFCGLRTDALIGCLQPLQELIQELTNLLCQCLVLRLQHRKLLQDRSVGQHRFHTVRHPFLVGLLKGQLPTIALCLFLLLQHHIPNAESLFSVLLCQKTGKGAVFRRAPVLDKVGQLVSKGKYHHALAILTGV